MNKILIVLFLIVSFSARASFLDSVSTHDWNGIEVTWVKDDRFPTYGVMFYFADGSMSDKVPGMTEAMFSVLDKGTRRYTLKQIADSIEFYGVNYSHSVFNEYSTFHYSGLTKDLVPTTKMFCHMFQDAIFPKKRVSDYKKSSKASLRSMINNHGALANRIFRELSMRGTEFQYPSGGKIKDINKVNRKRLVKKLDYYNNEVLKRIYVYGPKEVLAIKNVIEKDCHWTGESSKFTRLSVKKNSAPKHQIYLATVPNANQTQVRIGRYLEASELSRPELMNLTSSFLGGGFTSKLMREVRVKRGLTYSIGSYAAAQRDYGRAGISTFTKNQTVPELLEVIKNSIDETSVHIKEEEFQRAKNILMGTFPLQYETSAQLTTLLNVYNHRKLPLERLENYVEKIRKATRSDVIADIKNIFAWGKQTIVILGPKSLRKELKEKNIPFKEVNYTEFL